MDRKHSSIRSFISLFVVLGVSLATSGSAYALNPPPPSFWNFKIKNSTTRDISNIVISLTPVVDTNHDLLEQVPMTITLSTLKAGKSLILFAQSPLQEGLWGIAKIEIAAVCPNAPGLTPTSLILAAPLFIQGQLGTWPLPPPPTGNSRYAYTGFCYQHLTAPTTYQPLLEFTEQGSQPSAPRYATLTGRSRYGDTSLPAVTATQTFQ